jgi:hypothetical protein
LKTLIGVVRFCLFDFFLFFNQFEYLFFFSWRISSLEVRRMFLNKNMLKIEYLDNKVFIAYFFDQPCGSQNLGMYMMYCRLQFLKK